REDNRHAAVLTHGQRARRDRTGVSLGKITSICSRETDIGDRHRCCAVIGQSHLLRLTRGTVKLRQVKRHSHRTLSYIAVDRTRGASRTWTAAPMLNHPCASVQSYQVALCQQSIARLVPAFYRFSPGPGKIAEQRPPESPLI